MTLPLVQWVSHSGREAIRPSFLSFASAVTRTGDCAGKDATNTKGRQRIGAKRRREERIIRPHRWSYVMEAAGGFYEPVSKAASV